MKARKKHNTNRDKEIVEICKRKSLPYYIIGKMYRISKQRVHQIYKESVENV
jgi:DNA-directed RNA polymerase specialized sigma subunit